jgi:hypothetical protein
MRPIGGFPLAKRRPDNHSRVRGQLSQILSVFRERIILCEPLYVMAPKRVEKVMR